MVNLTESQEATLLFLYAVEEEVKSSNCESIAQAIFGLEENGDINDSFWIHIGALIDKGLVDGEPNDDPFYDYSYNVRSVTSLGREHVDKLVKDDGILEKVKKGLQSFDNMCGKILESKSFQLICKWVEIIK